MTNFLKLNKALILLLVTGGIFYFGVNLSSAAEGYTVTPRVIDVSAEARDIISRTITITNDANNITSIFPSVNEISLTEGGDIQDFKGPTMVDRTAAITSWLEVPRKEINIKPGESYDVPVAIRMNPNTQPGEYHALIGFGSGRVRADAERLVEQGRAPGVVVTIRVEDVSVERVDLEGFFIEKFVTKADNKAARYTLNNPGDTVVVPEGEIVFYDGNGKEVASISANPDHLTLQPGEKVEVETTVPVKRMIGRHKAFLNVNYGTNQAASVYDTTFFYVLPWQKLLLIFGIVLFIALVLTLFLYKKYSVDDDEDEDVHHLQFRFKEGASELKDHDINLKKTDSNK